jgi:hypothetical protein
VLDLRLDIYQLIAFPFFPVSMRLLKGVIAKSFSRVLYADARRYLESNQQIGRVVVTV